MTYISSDGTIHQGSTPWRAWILKLFWGVINFIIMFFKSLFNPELHKKGSRYTTDYRPNGRGPPPPPRRRLGALAPEDRGIWLAVEGALWQVDEVKNGPCNLHPLDYLGPSSNV